MSNRSNTYPQVAGFLLTVCSRFRAWVHAARMRVLLAAVVALIRGGSLMFSSLGRALPGRPKYGIKRIDRLLSNTKLHRELPLFYSSLGEQLLADVDRPIVLIDWTKAVEGFYALSATVAMEGRSLPLYTEVHPEKKQGNRRVQSRFLKQLERVLPTDCHPILCFDSGFGSEFCHAIVQKHGWGFVSRIRGNLSICPDGSKQWVPGTSLYSRTRRETRDFGLYRVCQTGRTNHCRIVGIKAPRSKGRKKHPRRKVPRSGAKRSARTAAKEPWILYSSLHDEPAIMLVNVYRKRMQIEEHFRDLKNPRFGWSLRHVRSQSRQRLQVLFLVAALAMLAMLLIGRLAERVGIHREYQGNTIRKRRVLSFFVLGKLLIERGDTGWLSRRELREELASVQEYLSQDLCRATC